MTFAALLEAVLETLRANADERGRVQMDKHALARATGATPSRCSTARAELINRRIIRKIGNSRPTLLQVFPR